MNILSGSRRAAADPQDKLIIASDALDVDDILGLHAYFGGTIASGVAPKDFACAADFWTARSGRPAAAFASAPAGARLLTNDFRDCDPAGGNGFDPISLICKVSTVEGRPAVKLSDNYAKAVGPPPKSNAIGASLAPPVSKFQ